MRDERPLQYVVIWLESATTYCTSFTRALSSTVIWIVVSYSYVLSSTVQYHRSS